MEDVAAILCSLDQQLFLLTAVLTTLLTTIFLVFAVAAYSKSLQEKRKRGLIALASLQNTVEETSKTRGELVLYSSSTSGHAEQTDILHFSRELDKYSTSSVTTTPVQRVSKDNGELVVS